MLVGMRVDLKLVHDRTTEEGPRILLEPPARFKGFAILIVYIRPNLTKQVSYENGYSLGQLVESWEALKERGGLEQIPA